MFRVSFSSYLPFNYQFSQVTVFKTLGRQTVNVISKKTNIIGRPTHSSKSILPPCLESDFFWFRSVHCLFACFACRIAQVISNLVSSLMHLTAGSVPRRVKQVCSCAGNVLDFHYWLWHVRQRTQHVPFKGKLCSSACFKCVSKPVVKDAIYSVFQKPLSKFLTKAAENQRHLIELSHTTNP